MITKLWKTDTCLSKYNNLNHSLVGQYLPVLLVDVIYHLFTSTQEKHDRDTVAVLAILLKIFEQSSGSLRGVQSPPNTFIASPKYLLDNIGHEKYVFFNLAKNEQPIPTSICCKTASPIFLFFRYWKSWCFQFIKEWQYIVYTTFQLKYNKNMLIKI